MDFSSKRRRSFAAIYLFMFLCGVEYAVVFPTLWEFLLSLGVPESEVSYMGAAVSALTVADMLGSLALGRAVDKISRVKAFFLVLNSFQILSSVLYLLARSPTWIIVSRLVGGLGNVSAVGLIADVSRATSKQERTPVMVWFSIARQVGLLLGPACNLFLRQCNFTVSIGSFSLKVNKLNAPGLFMGSLYVVLEIVVFLFYYDLARAKLEEEREVQDQAAAEQDQRAQANHQLEGNEQNIDDDRNEESNPPNVDQERMHEGDMINIQIRPNDQPALAQDGLASEPVVPPTWSEYVDEILLNPTILSLMFLRVIGLFGQTCFETIATPMMRQFFHYGDLENSLLYLGGGIELLIISIAMAWLAKRVEDRKFVAVGVALHFATLIFFLVSVPRFRPGDRGNLPLFAVGVALDLASISIILDISIGLLTKLVRDEVQGFAAGVRRFLSNLALLLGPLWGGGALQYLDVLFAVPLVLLCVGAVLFALSFREMKVNEEHQVNEVVREAEDTEGVDETSPLVSNAVNSHGNN